MNTIPRPHLFGLLAGLALAGALCFASLIATRAWIRLKESQLIKVTGSARKNVRSDLVVWSAMLQADGTTLDQARRQFSADLEKVQRFLQGHNITEASQSPIKVLPLRPRAKADTEDDRPMEPAGFRLTQEFQVSSAEVEGIPHVAAASLSLIGEGVVFQTLALEFIYTKAGETKVGMMAEATADARARAEQIALQGGRSLGRMHAAKSGVVQINPLHSTETSWEGINDKTSLHKTITVTISADFGLN